MATTRHALGDFLVRLGAEPEFFAEYLENRGGVMEREGLTLSDRDAILAGDLRELRARLREEYSATIEPGTIMRERPEEEPGEPPTIMAPEEPEKPPTIMEPEEPEEEPPTIMDPEEPKPDWEPQAE
jgi:hypothetical protein